MRKLSLLLVVIMLLSFTAGCGGKTEVKGNPDHELEHVTLIWYLIGTPQTDLQKVLEEVNEYTVEKINTTIDLRMLDWGEYSDRMQVIIASGEEYDIAFTSSWANNYALNARRGAFLEISDLMDQYGKEMKEVIDPAFLEGAKINGGLYAVPTNKEVGQQAVLAYNKDLADKHGFDLSGVTSIEDMEPFFQVIKEKEPNVSPIATFDAFLPFDSLLQEEMPFAFRLEGDTTKVVNKYEEDITRETLRTMHSYYKKGYIRPDAATSTNTWPMEVQNWFVRKELYQPYAELLWSRSAGYNIGYVPLQQPHVFNNSVTGSMHAISATSKNPERAMMFLNLLNTDTYLRTLVDKGIEGVHYTLNDDGTITDLPARVQNYNMPSFAIGNLMVLRLHDDEPEGKWEAFAEFNNSSIPSPALGFYFDPGSVRTEIAAISNVTRQFAPALLKGAVDPDEYLDKFNEKLYEAGLQKVLDEIQSQYDRWRANN